MRAGPSYIVVIGATSSAPALEISSNRPASAFGIYCDLSLMRVDSLLLENVGVGPA